jgi:alpha-beta hydrolase superfamily lysophospholipase
MPDASFTFSDSDDYTIHAYRWDPGGRDPSAVVQIAHGMLEHCGRYERSARELASAGYAVYANDHRGHGRTMLGAGDRGRLGPGGWRSLLAGLRQLTGIAREAHPDLPVFLLGHSFGSFLAQAYIQRWGEDLAGAALSGTNGRNTLLRVGLAAARLIARKQGLDTTATTLRSLTIAGYNKPFDREPGATGKEWLSRDRESVREYVDDPLCGGVPPNSFFVELLELLDHIWRPENERRIPRALPIYMFAGTEDPVGGRTRGVEALARRYRRHGMADVEVRFYRGARHETLNETNRDEVIADLVAWLDRHRGG